MNATVPLALFYVIVSICLALVFVYLWLSNFQETRPFKYFGLIFVSAVIAVDLFVLIKTGFESIRMSPIMIAFMDALAAIKIYAISVVGMMFAQRLDDDASNLTPSILQKNQQTSYSKITLSKSALYYALMLTIFMMIYSYLLFSFSDAKIGDALRTSTNHTFEVTAVGIIVAGSMGFGEEIVFRLGLQNALTYLWRSSRYGHLLAVIIVSAFWSIGHIGAIDPDWVKFVQVFVFGLMLGQLNQMYGVLPCMISHSLFNVSMAAIAPQVLGNGLISG